MCTDRYPWSRRRYWKPLCLKSERRTSFSGSSIRPTEPCWRATRQVLCSGWGLFHIWSAMPRNALRPSSSITQRSSSPWMRRLPRWRDFRVAHFCLCEYMKIRMCAYVYMRLCGCLQLLLPSKPFIQKLLQHVRQVPAVLFVAQDVGGFAVRLLFQEMRIEFPFGVAALAGRPSFAPHRLGAGGCVRLLGRSLAYAGDRLGILTWRVGHDRFPFLRLRTQPRRGRRGCR